MSVKESKVEPKVRPKSDGAEPILTPGGPLAAAAEPTLASLPPAGRAILEHRDVLRAALTIRGKGETSLDDMLEIGRSMAAAARDDAREKRLRAELLGFETVGLDVPEERRVVGFASPFPVRAIGLLDPEEIFLANREKFSQVTLTIGQPARELEQALSQIEQGGVLALRVPAAEVSGEAATTEPDVEVFIYILPREIERVITAARQKALESVVHHLVDAVLGPRPLLASVEPADVTDPLDGKTEV